MANELTVNVKAALSNAGHKESFEVQNLRVTQAAVGAHAPVVAVGTSEEDLAVGDIGTLGWLFMKNLDPTNYVTWGPKNGSNVMQALGRIDPGECVALRLSPGITIRWQANTAACKVKVLLLED
jgi:hypothetical protein